MTPAEVWPSLPTCSCGEFFDGYVTGHLQGVRDGRAELAGEQLEAQRRRAERMEPASSVVAGLRAVAVRQHERRSAA